MRNKAVTELRIQDMQKILHVIGVKQLPLQIKLMRDGSLPDYEAGQLIMTTHIYDEMCGLMNEIIQGG
ncbi:hypothetical protein [Furfurilactobacillus milii]|uniref:Uncharacterized protein n=1 Tax=Furfurilactobacillus rossiae TaxID=231049 RepID=A0A7C9N512_9LACO|nr:hypothetical protein [Furfurilactobacillus milii]MYV04426.1 hypothetical protein [Furfurilactobacillus milii]